MDSGGVEYENDPPFLGKARTTGPGIGDLLLSFGERFMKAWPTIVVILLFLVLLYIGSLRPDDVVTPPGTSGPDSPSSTTSSASAPLDTSVPALADPGTKASEAPEQTEITGVVYTPDQRAAVGMEVHLTKSGGDVVSTTVTDAEGRFRFSGLSPEETFSVKAHDQNYIYTVFNRALVRPGEKGASAILQVSRGDCTLTGSFLSAAGTPLGNTEVQMTSSSGLEISAMTDSKGSFRIGGLPPGDWVVSPKIRPDHKVQVKLIAGKDQRVDLPPVPVLATLKFQFLDSAQHRYPFRGDEVAVLTPESDPSKPIQQAISVTEGGHSEHGEAVFDGLLPGRYNLSAISPSQTDPGKKSLLPRDLLVVVNEGENRTQALTLAVSKYGAGIKVSTGFLVFVFIFFGVMFALPFAVFPPPFVAKRPDTAPRPS